MNVGLLIFILSVISLLLIRYWPARNKDGVSFSLESKLTSELDSELDSEEQLTQHSFRKKKSDHWIISVAQDKDVIRFYFSIVITSAILIASLAVILKGSYPDSTEKWAYGAIGTVSGYWLKA